MARETGVPGRHPSVPGPPQAFAAGDPAAREADDSSSGDAFDDLFEALAHQLLELHPLLDHRQAAAAMLSAPTS
ncbi:MAG: hypothetical protein ACYCUM_13590 [Solirubrobacteraceae bacterium]